MTEILTLLGEQNQIRCELLHSPDEIYSLKKNNLVFWTIMQTNTYNGITFIIQNLLFCHL